VGRLHRSEVLVALGALMFASGAFAYLTAIPATTEGVLYSSIERAQPGGSIVGITGRAATTAGPTPEVDLEALGCSRVPGL